MPSLTLPRGGVSSWFARWSRQPARAALVPFGALLAGALAAQAPRISSPAPVKNYSLSFFSEAGFHSMHVRGAEANFTNPERIALRDLTLTQFTGDEARRVETVILSADATLVPENELVLGTSTVRLIRDDLELTGEDWQYEHAAKKILIRRNARIVFRAELGDLLK